MLRNRAVLTAAVAILTFFVFAFALFDLPSLPDTDSYYHLAVAKLYAEQGLVKGLPWARFSAMHDTFGDKELLFHILLIPFTTGDATTGGRLAIALLNAAIAGAITWIAVGELGPLGAALAPLLYLTAPYFWIRTMRLRPELLSLLLFLLIAHATARRKLWTIGLLSIALTLGHTAFHVLAAMAVLWWVALRFVPRSSSGSSEFLGQSDAGPNATPRNSEEPRGTRGTDWKAPAATLAGIAIGILVHPHFPDNVRIWYLQNVTFLQMKSALDVGAEIQPPRLANLLLHNAGWWLLAILAVALLRPWKRNFSRTSLVFLTLTAVFFILQLTMERMSTYFFPFATFAIALACATQSPLPSGERARVRGGSRATVEPRALAGAAITIIAILASLPFTLRTTRALAARLPPNVERDYTALGASIPAGAKIAARWGPTDAYVFFAPKARYLNVLDPVFMAAPHPHAYQAQRRLFEGLDPDIPRTAKRDLDSDYLAFPKWEAAPLLTARITHDPRLVRIHDGYNVLLRIQPSTAFITDWNGRPPTAGFVDALATHCTTFTRTLAHGRYELAPWGPTRVWLDGRAVAETRTAPLAIVGRGRIIDVGSAAEMKIETCGADGRAGFYLVRR